MTGVRNVAVSVSGRCSGLNVSVKVGGEVPCVVGGMRVGEGKVWVVVDGIPVVCVYKWWSGTRVKRRYWWMDTVYSKW